MRGDFEDEGDFEKYVEEWCECGENWFGVTEESGWWMIRREVSFGMLRIGWIGVRRSGVSLRSLWNGKII